MAPHLIRAWSTYKGLCHTQTHLPVFLSLLTDTDTQTIYAHRSFYTNNLTHTHTHTSTHTQAHTHTHMCTHTHTHTHVHTHTHTNKQHTHTTLCFVPQWFSWWQDWRKAAGRNDCASTWGSVQTATSWETTTLPHSRWGCISFYYHVNCNVSVILWVH